MNDVFRTYAVEPNGDVADLNAFTEQTTRLITQQIGRHERADIPHQEDN